MQIKTRMGLSWKSRLGIRAAVLLATAVFLLWDSRPAQTNAWVFPDAIRSLFGCRQEVAGVDLAIWKNKDYVAINRCFESVKTDFSAELIKAIAWCESEWSQMDEAGRAFYTVNYHRNASGGWTTSLDWGLMQINERMESLDPEHWDLERIKSDPEYNLRAGIAVLQSKRIYVRNLKRRKDWKTIEDRYDLKGHSELEITLKAYNGFQRSWRYLHRINHALARRPWEKAMLRQMHGSAARPQIEIRYEGRRPLRMGLPTRGAAWDKPLEAENRVFYRLELSRQ